MLTLRKYFSQSSGRHQRHRTDLKSSDFHSAKAISLLDNFSFSKLSLPPDDVDGDDDYDDPQTTLPTLPPFLVMKMRMVMMSIMMMINDH